MVDAESTSNHGLAAAAARHPGKSHTRVDIAVVLLAEASADPAESLRPARGEIKRVGQPVLLVEEIEDGIAQAQVECEVGPPPVLVLCVAEVIVLAQVVDRQSS